MRKLTVKNFSVIKDATLEFGKITVLIGPQASGKSLLCKLAYFFEQVVPERIQRAFMRKYKRSSWINSQRHHGQGKIFGSRMNRQNSPFPALLLPRSTYLHLGSTPGSLVTTPSGLSKIDGLESRRVPE